MSQKCVCFHRRWSHCTGCVFWKTEHDVGDLFELPKHNNATAQEVAHDTYNKQVFLVKYRVDMAYTLIDTMRIIINKPWHPVDCLLFVNGLLDSF